MIILATHCSRQEQVAQTSLRSSGTRFRYAFVGAALSLVVAAGIPNAAHAVTDPGPAIDAISAHAPDIVAPASPTTLDGSVVAPTITDLGASDGILATEGSLTESMISTDPSAGFAFGTGWGYLSVVPVRTDGDADSATVVNDAAAVFQGTAPGADTIIRPSALGVSTYTQIRSGAAPETYSWRLSLPGGQVLKPTDDGSVAVVASSSPLADTPPVDAFDAAVAASDPPSQGAATATVPPQPAPDASATPTAEAQTPQEQAVPDTEAQVDSATKTLAAASEQVDGHIVAAIQKPWAVDANGKQVPVSLSVEGDVVTMTVDHRGGDYELPIVADPDLIDCAHASPCGTYHAGRAAAYAYKWRASRNSSYKGFSQDCTNFMSQILRAGGLGYMRNFETGKGSWWMKKNGPFYAPWNWTHSWSIADDLVPHLLDYGLARNINGPYRTGDLIAYDFDPNGVWDHFNFVVNMSDGEPHVVAHTNDYPTPQRFDSIRARIRNEQHHPNFRWIHLRLVHAYANIAG